MLLEKQKISNGYNAVYMFVLIKGDAKKFIEFVEQVFGGIERKDVRTPDKDGTLIHSEVQLGDSSILIADSKPDWLFTPAFIQVYVEDAQTILDRAQKAGAVIVTEVCGFYNGFKLARLRDVWGNIWWLYEPDSDTKEIPAEPKSDTSWHNKKPSKIYTTFIEAMRELKPKNS
jgi:PhnB protein